MREQVDARLAELRALVVAALGYDVTVTNLTRVLTRRQMIEPTGSTRSHSRAGGRPAAEYRFRHRTPTVTAPFAAGEGASY